MIVLEDVSADFGLFQIKNINLEIQQGEYFVILGPTGAGKTLILELIAGFHRVKHGRILIHGKDLAHVPTFKRNIGIVYQDYSLFPNMDVESNIRFGLEMRGFKEQEIANRTKDMINKFNINHLAKRIPTTLSGGEQQKVALARALIINPSILLLDEPFSALDPVSRKEAMKIIKIIHKESNLTTIKVTHNQDEAILGDRVALLMEGTIVDVGTPRKIFNEPRDVKNAAFVGIENILKGEIIHNENGYAEVKTGKFNVHCMSKFHSGEVTLFIRPENIIISKAPLESSLRNSVKATVQEIFHISKELVELALNNGLKAYLTQNALEDLEIKEDDEVYASFKATAVSLKR